MRKNPPLLESDIVCHYGQDIEKEYLQWLEEDARRCLILLEDEKESELIRHPQIDSVFLREGAEEMILKKIVWDHLFLKIHYAASSKKKKAAELGAQIQALYQGIHLIASDWSDLELRVVKNVLENMKKLSCAYRGKDLFGKFQGIPAIICGSGPSLAKNIQQLKGLEGKALIFAGGTALPLLAEKGIAINFSAAIDPDPPPERFASHTYHKVPFFYQNRVDQKILSQVQGPLFWLPDCGSSLLERHLFEEEVFDGGWNVATFCTALATHLGCSPLIFVGMDLAAEKGQIYAPGVQATAQEQRLIEICNEEGISFYTKNDWLMARSWLENYATKHPETQFLNATEGGLAIPCIENMSLDFVAENYLSQSANLENKVTSVVKNLHPRGQKEAMDQEIEKIRFSFSQVKELCAAFLKRLEEIFPASFKTDGIATVLLFELEEELAYKCVLETVWEVWKPRLLRENSTHPELQKILLFKRMLEDF